MKIFIFLVLCLTFSLSYGDQDATTVLGPQRSLSLEERGKYWFGKVEASRAYKNDKNETVIEWYCHRYEMLTFFDLDAPKSHIQTVKVIDHGSSHFVSTLRTKDMDLEFAQQLASEATEIPHFSYWPDARVFYVGMYLDKETPFIGDSSGTITDKVRILFEEE